MADELNKKSDFSKIPGVATMEKLDGIRAWVLGGSEAEIKTKEAYDALHKGDLKSFLNKGVEGTKIELEGLSKSLIGEVATKDTIEGTQKSFSGQDVAGSAQMLKADFESVAHLATLPVRLLDKALCGTGILHCPPEPVAPQPVPRDNQVAKDGRSFI